MGIEWAGCAGEASAHFWIVFDSLFASIWYVLFAFVLNWDWEDMQNTKKKHNVDGW